MTRLDLHQTRRDALAFSRLDQSDDHAGLPASRHGRAAVTWPGRAVAVGQASYGTVKGRLVWGGDTLPPAVDLVEKGKAPKDPEICAKDQSILSHALEVDPKSKGVAHGFAYIIRPKGTNPDAVKDLLAAKPKLEIDQKNCDFRAALDRHDQDQSLVLKSSDAVGHNVRLTRFQ